MSSRIEFETPENVQVAYQLAGLGTRFVAWFVDNILMVGLMLVIFVGLVCAGVATESVFRSLEEGMRDVAGADRFPESANAALLYVLGLIVLVWGLGSFVYYAACEFFLRGQTPGKRLAGIRVVRADGFALEPGAILVRNIFRVVDHLPPLWIVPVVSQRSQRLGDMAAGTLVITDKPERFSPLREALLRRPAAEARFFFDAAMLKRARPQDFEAVEKILERWGQLGEMQKEILLAQIVAPLTRRLKTAEPPEADRVAFLEDLLAAEYRRQHRSLG